MTPKVKAYVYLTRPSADGPQLLVFCDGREDGPLQVPGGTIEPGETPEAAAVREVAEEAGLPIHKPRLFWRTSWYNPWGGRKGRLHDRHLLHADAPDGVPGSFGFGVTGGGDDAGRTFYFRWIPLGDAGSRLDYDFGVGLDALYDLRGMPHPAGPTLRLAQPAHLTAVNDIFNHYVHTSPAIYVDKPIDADERLRWYQDRNWTLHPAVVAEVNGHVLGYATLGPFSSRCGYRLTAENSLYVRPDVTGRGIGSLLLADLLRRAREAELHGVVALVDAGQEGSLALHRRFGFVEAGRLREVGYKFGAWRDVVYLQRLLTDHGVTPPLPPT